MITATDDEARDAKVVNQMTLEQLERDMNDPEILRHKEIIRRYKAGESYITIKRELDRLHPEWHMNANHIAKAVSLEEKRDPTFQRRGTNYNKATGEVGHHRRSRISQPKEKKPSPRTYFSDEDCIDIWVKHKRGIPAEEIARDHKIPAGRGAVYRVCARVDRTPRLRRMAKREWIGKDGSGQERSLTDVEAVDLWVEREVNHIDFRGLAVRLGVSLATISRTLKRVNSTPTLREKAHRLFAAHRDVSNSLVPEVRKAEDLIPSEKQVLEQELAYANWKIAGYEHGFINRYLRETKF